ncbi:clostripain-related cysteine peptidase [Alistipes sp.]|uniref:clostripain-related cysteine peptidase n=1 Tax=Alistipes sp. TaxID=1872444 RepID=UPI0025C70701|nr:clostripain-related cysteine peptidase [Alistipes sp.]
MIRPLRHAFIGLVCAVLLASCSKGNEGPGYVPPETAEQTHLMYMPWSDNLTSYFRINIDDMARVVADGIDDDVRVLVFFMESATSGSLFEMYRQKGECVRRTIKSYTAPIDFTSAAGIASILGDVKAEAPARRYTMSIGSHGMAWLPVVSQTKAPQRSNMQPRREYWEYAAPDRPLTRWFGGVSTAHRTEIRTLAEALTQAGLYMDYILFDDCYMSSVEVAYDLRHVTDYLIGSTSEIMAYGFPYALAGEYMLGEVDYEGICDAFHGFYSTYEYPYGTIGVTCCAELDDLADVMRRINSACTFDTSRVDELQRLDGYSPALFFDMGDYVRHLCTDTALLDEFERQLARTVPWHRHTDYYYSMTNGKNPIHTFSGITTSDPSIDPEIMIDRQQTAWYQATH